MKLEICVDSYESLENAVRYGADRIELCVSLKEGGLTPPVSFIEKTLRSIVPVFIMIRPRSCDFLYSSSEIEMMLRDIHFVRNLGAPGVVFGVLNAEGDIDMDAMKSLVRQAGTMEVTCHRAFDQARDTDRTIENLVELGVKRILTSGRTQDPADGIETLAHCVRQARQRIGIMAAGVSPANVGTVISQGCVDEIHSAALVERKSRMGYLRSDTKMGNGIDYTMNVVDPGIIQSLKSFIH